jgi:hypothetical protein
MDPGNRPVIPPWNKGNALSTILSRFTTLLVRLARMLRFPERRFSKSFRGLSAPAQR